MKRTNGYNSTYKKLAVQWLNKALCFVSSLVVADSFRLRNRQHLVAAKRYVQILDDMKQIILSTMAILILTSMTFKYDKMNFYFESLEKLETKISTTSEFDDRIIFEQEYENKAKDITINFRIIDFSKQEKIKNPNVNDDKVLEIANEYLNDIKMTGAVENFEMPIKTQVNWIYYSAVAKLSKDQKSVNVYYLKRFDNLILIVSIGSIKTKIEDLKMLGQKISTTFKIADK